MKIQTVQAATPRSHSKRSRGFTLVEVMITITIIAVLALVVVVMTRRIKTSALQAKAVNTIRQVGVANVGFSAENNGDINVLLDGNDPRHAGKYITKNFWGLLGPYLFPDVTLADNKATGTELKIRLEALLSTTNSKFMTGTFQQGPQAYADASGLVVPFAFNTNVHQWGKYLKVSQYDDPSRVLYMTYGFYRFDQADGDKYAAIPKSKADRVNNIDYFQNKTAACTFLDGHVEVLSPPMSTPLFGTKPVAK